MMSCSEEMDQQEGRLDNVIEKSPVITATDDEIEESQHHNETNELQQEFTKGEGEELQPVDAKEDVVEESHQEAPDSDIGESQQDDEGIEDSHQEEVYDSDIEESQQENMKEDGIEESHQEEPLDSENEESAADDGLEETSQGESRDEIIAEVKQEYDNDEGLEDSQQEAVEDEMEEENDEEVDESHLDGEYYNAMEEEQEDASDVDMEEEADEDDIEDQPEEEINEGELEDQPEETYLDEMEDQTEEHLEDEIEDQPEETNEDEIEEHHDEVYEDDDENETAQQEEEEEEEANYGENEEWQPEEPNNSEVQLPQQEEEVSYRRTRLRPVYIQFLEDAPDDPSPDDANYSDYEIIPSSVVEARLRCRRPRKKRRTTRRKLKAKAKKKARPRGRPRLKPKLRIKMRPTPKPKPPPAPSPPPQPVTIFDIHKQLLEEMRQAGDKLKKVIKEQNEFEQQLINTQEAFLGRERRKLEALEEKMEIERSRPPPVYRPSRKKQSSGDNITKPVGLGDTIDGLDDLEFFRTLRITKETYNLLLSEITDKYTPIYRGGRTPIETTLAMKMCLWYLGNKGTYKEMAELFGISESAVFKSVHIVVDIICGLSVQYIKWPTGDRISEVENSFRSMCGFPGVIGALDGTHVKVRAPKFIKADFVDKTKKHSVNLMAVCDNDRRFTFIEAGFPGSAHDSSVLKNTKLYNLMWNSPRDLFPSDDTHIIGDSAFELSKYVLVPYMDYGNPSNLTEPQKRFNQKLALTRSVISHAFGFLKGRFRRLKYIDADVARISKVIVACCVIHNITLDNAQELELLTLDGEVAPVAEELDYSYPHINFLDTIGSSKRDFIASVLV